MNIVTLHIRQINQAPVIMLEVLLMDSLPMYSIVVRRSEGLVTSTTLARTGRLIFRRTLMVIRLNVLCISSGMII